MPHFLELLNFYLLVDKQLVAYIGEKTKPNEPISLPSPWIVVLHHDGMAKFEVVESKSS